MGGKLVYAPNIVAYFVYTKKTNERKEQRHTKCKWQIQIFWQTNGWRMEGLPEEGRTTKNLASLLYTWNKSLVQQEATALAIYRIIEVAVTTIWTRLPNHRGIAWGLWPFGSHFGMLVFYNTYTEYQTYLLSRKGLANTKSAKNSIDTLGSAVYRGLSRYLI